MSETLSLPTPEGGGAAVLADPRAGLYDIVIEFAGAWTPQLQAAFLAAEARIETLVLADLPDAAVSLPDGTTALVDDLVIRAELPAIDGPGGTLGSSVPTVLRSDGLLPATAVMSFDEADAAALEAQGAWADVVLHEMLHCLGFGTLWAAKGLVAAGGAYVGPAAMGEYAAMGGAGPVPVETTGDAATAGLHWSEAAFGAELMTGWMGAAAALGPVTVASLADLGYGLAPRSQWAVDAAYA